MPLYRDPIVAFMLIDGWAKVAKVQFLAGFTSNRTEPSQQIMLVLVVGLKGLQNPGEEGGSWVTRHQTPKWPGMMMPERAISHRISLAQVDADHTTHVTLGLNQQRIRGRPRSGIR